MLVQKLRVDDLQSEKGYFDGVMVYAQNKVGECNPGFKTRFLCSSLFFICLAGFGFVCVIWWNRTEKVIQKWILIYNSSE